MDMLLQTKEKLGTFLPPLFDYLFLFNNPYLACVIVNDTDRGGR